jgi:hypothetical protein
MMSSMVLRMKTILLVTGLCLVLADCTLNHGQDANIPGIAFPDYAYPLDGYSAFPYGDHDRWAHVRWGHR